MMLDPTGMFGAGQAYVALSRATSEEGLMLRAPLDAGHIKTSAAVQNYTRAQRAATTAASDLESSAGAQFAGTFDCGTFAAARRAQGMLDANGGRAGGWVGAAERLVAAAALLEPRTGRPRGDGGVSHWSEIDPEQGNTPRGGAVAGQCFRCKKPGHWIKDCPLAGR